MTDPIPIASLDDPRIADFRDVRDRELRRTGPGQRFIVESARCVARLLRSRFVVESIFCSPRRLAELAPALAAAEVALRSVSIHVAEESLIADIAGYHVHGGALALARRPSGRALSFPFWAERLGAVDSPNGASGDRSSQSATRGDTRSPRTIIALSGVTHMDNVGSIFRSAAGLGVDGVLLDERCCDPLLRKPIRVAMGHSLTLPFAWSHDLGSDLGALRGLGGWRIVALEEGVEHRAARKLDRLPETERLVIVAGNEGHGLDASLIALSDDLVEIPMSEGVPSLNVAVAVAVACWERRRRGGERSPVCE